MKSEIGKIIDEAMDRRDTEIATLRSQLAERDALVGDVLAEIARAIKKFPKWPTDPLHAAAIIAEECGELQKSVLEAVYEPHKGSRDNIKAEAVQTAAMCLRFIASIDKYEWFSCKQHWQTEYTALLANAGGVL